MRFMIIRKADAETESELSPAPSTELLEAMIKYNEEMVQAGVFLGGDGLKPSSQGSRVKFNNGKPTVYDGPFAETKELVAGYSIIQVASKEEAIEWVKKWPPLDGDGNVEIEIRPFYEADDFGDAFTPELRALEDSQRERIEEQQKKSAS